VAVEAQNLLEQIHEQVLQGVQDFYGKSLGSLENQLGEHRSQLKELQEQLPDSQEDVRAQIGQLLASYEVIEKSLQETAREQGVEEMVSQAVQQAQVAAGRSAQQAQEVAGQAAEQVQETAGQAAEGARGAAGEALGQAQESVGQATEQAQGLVGQVTEVAENEPNVTRAAKRKAEELGVDLHKIAPSGSDGRITLRDVKSAAQG
jgi:pyruvate/2-oxoglutarate dehydrogenase complex dihydrolipoamide acyltransferase (E2) component